MKQSEAKKITKRIKEGSSFSRGHYSAGYEEIFFDSKKEVFIYRQKNTGLDIYNPDVRDTLLTETELVKKLTDEFKHKDVADYLS